MPRTKWDYYKTERAPLSASRKTPGAFRGLVHGPKGVKKQAEFFKVDNRQSFRSRVLGLATKTLLVVVAVSVVIAVAATLVMAVINGVATGLASVGEVISAASAYLVIGASVIAAGVVAGATLKAASSAKTRHGRSSHGDASVYTWAKEGSPNPNAQQPILGRVAFDQGPMWTQPSAPFASAPGVAANWFEDPSSAAHLRYWDGRAWTDHRRPKRTTAAPSAGWYVAPLDATRFRYWNGSAWTDHFAPREAPSPPHQQTTTPATGVGQPFGDYEHRTAMSSAEWQNHVQAWMTAGALQQELWRRLSNARITDADPRTVEAQRRMELLTPEQGAHRVRLMLEANPILRDERVVTDLLSHLLQHLDPADHHERLSHVSDPAARRH